MSDREFVVAWGNFREAMEDGGSADQLSSLCATALDAKNGVDQANDDQIDAIRDNGEFDHVRTVKAGLPASTQQQLDAAGFEALTT